MASLVVQPGDLQDACDAPLVAYGLDERHQPVRHPRDRDEPPVVEQPGDESGQGSDPPRSGGAFASHGQRRELLGYPDHPANVRAATGGFGVLTDRQPGAAYSLDMATWDDVRRIALALPETDEHPSHGGAPAWRVRKKGFVWERPLRKADLLALGDDAPDGHPLGAHVADLGVKEALIADDPAVFFTTPHFNGYPAVLVRLDRIAVAELEELVVDAWLARAPKRLAKEYLEASH